MLKTVTLETPTTVEHVTVSSQIVFLLRLLILLIDTLRCF